MHTHYGKSPPVKRLREGYVIDIVFKAMISFSALSLVVFQTTTLHLQLLTNVFLDDTATR